MRTTQRFYQWRVEFKKALIRHRQWERFVIRRKQIQHDIMELGVKDPDTVMVRSWKAAAEEFPGILDEDEFELLRQKTLKKRREDRKKRALKVGLEIIKGGGVMTPQKDALIEEEIERLIDPAPDHPVQVFIENAVEGDILRDTKWVYYNMSRIIKQRRNGQRYMDMKALKEAPSNGAVALAQYALDEPKAFFERFVMRILPKDETPEKVPTQEEIRAELDPGLDELERYMKKNLK